MEVYGLVAFIAAMILTIGGGLMFIDFILRKKMLKEVDKAVCEDVIPASEKALDNYTTNLLESVKQMTEEAMKAFKD